MKSRIYSFFNQYVFEVFSLDLRSLALFRICLGLILIADLIVRAEHLEDYYTDLGVLPRSFLIDNYLHPCQWSFHLLSGETLIQIILFGVAILFALALIMGYQTRMVTIISWVFLVSLQNRNLMVNDHGDLVLRLLLFWSIFLPLGAKFSVDEIKKGKSFETEFFSVGTMALILQICFIYWFTVLWKSSALWTKEFSAIYYAFNLDYLSKPLAKFLLNYPTLLKSLTCSTLYIEFYIPFLLFIPRFTKVLRLIVISIFIGLHTSFILCLYLGLFPLISITAWLVLIPSLFWDKIFKLSTIKNLKVRINKLINKINYKLAIKVNNTNYNLKPFLPAELMCSLFLYCIFISNLASLKLSNWPITLNNFSYTFAIKQSWPMFSYTTALQSDGYFVIKGYLDNKKQINLSQNAKQKTIKYYENQRQSNFMAYLFHSKWREFNKYTKQDLLIENYAKYLCYQWNTVHNNKLEKVQINFITETTVAMNDISEANKNKLKNFLMIDYKCQNKTNNN